jgi:hypothetical protein
LKSLKKKKTKDKDKKQATTSTTTPSPPTSNSTTTVPANIHIQQQFEVLQQQQQSQKQSYPLIQTPPNPIPSSISSQSMSTAANNTAINPMTASTISQPGSSSPAAFKSLFRTLRVGSLKHQSPNSSSNNNINSVTQIASPQQIHDASTTSMSYKHTDLATSPPRVTQVGRTPSTVTTTTTTSFKPVSSTLGITPQSSADTIVGKSELYSNCITQLQSTHSAMKEAQNITSFTGSLSPSSSQQQHQQQQQTTMVPMLVRTNKLNQSQMSINSNLLNGTHHNHHNNHHTPNQNQYNQQHQMSTFRDSQSATTTTTLTTPVMTISELKKGRHF